jgi:hypothetical protein
MEDLEAFANMSEPADSNDVFVIATGTAPHTDSVDMDLLIKFMKSQPTKNFYVFLFDERWNEVPHLSLESDNIYLYYLGNLPETPKEQKTVRTLGNLQRFGESCPIQEGTIWNTLKRAAMNFPELYIYNCAWWNRPDGTQENAYFENMCELANIFATHPNAFVLENNRSKNIFSHTQSELATRISQMDMLFKISKPGRFRMEGGRKRTRRGLKKRRASRRWKHRS